jgi:hypothetical protein
MKILLLLLMIPVLADSQTIHVKDKEIYYEGKEHLGATPVDLVMMLPRLIDGLTSHYRVEEQAGDSVKLSARIRLNTPHHLIRYVNYNFRLKLLQSGYEYVIDSVFLTEQERGENVDTVSSKKLIENMEETGEIVGVTEKILNEIDMRFQKLVAVLRSEMKKNQPSR